MLQQFVRLFFVALLGFFCVGCGGNFLSGIHDDPTPIPTVRIEVSALDGPLIKARVRLVSLLEGTLDTQTTDSRGHATLSLPRADLSALSDQDLLYFYVDSLKSLSTSVEPQSKSTRVLQEGQVRLKSFLPPVTQIKNISSNLLSSDPDLAKASVISHFSNAQAVLAEANLKSLGILNKSIRPENRISPADIPLVNSNIRTVESAIRTGDPNLTPKFKLVAMATKALVENDVSEFLTGASKTNIASSDEILLELAENGSGSNPELALKSSFQQSIVTLSQAISMDLSSEEIRSVFADSATPNAINDVTAEKVEAAVGENLISQIQTLVLSQTKSLSELANLSILGSSGDIKLSFDVSVPADFGVTLEFAYSLDGGQTFTVPVSTTPSISSLPFQTATSFIWHSFLDFQTDEESVSLRLNLSYEGSPIETSQINNLSIPNLPNRTPVSENLSLSGTSGDISIQFDLIDPDQDQLSVLFEFSTDGGQIFTPSSQTTPSLASLSPATATSFIWHSSQNFQTDETVVIRLTPSDPESTGTSLNSASFQISNLPNLPPSISNLTLSGDTQTTAFGSTSVTGFKRDVLVGFNTVDPNNDPLDLHFEFSLDRGVNWNISTHTSILLSSIPAGQKTTFFWETFRDFQTDELGVQIRLTPSDGLLQGAAITTSTFAVLNEVNTTPTAQNLSVTGNTGDLQISIDLADDEGDSLNLSFEYSADGGQTYTVSANTTPSLLSLSPVTSTSFVWHSSQDFQSDETSVRLRLVPSDGKLSGTTLISSIFEVLNQPNTVPSLANLSLSSGSGSIPISVDLIDADNEPLSLGFEYSLNAGTSWTTSVNSSPALTNLSPTANFSFNWLSSLDFQSDEIEVQVRLTPADSESTGSALISTLFSVSNFVNTTPSISQISTSETSGDIQVGFLVTDSDAHTLSLTFEYSVNSGQSWVQSLNTTPGLASVSSPYITSFTWNSAQDITTDETGVQIRLTPFDGIDAGDSGSSSIFSILNFVNSTPTVSIDNITGTSGNILFNILATDSNSDTLSLSFEFSLDSGANWAISTHTTPSLTSLASPYITTFSWHSQLDTTIDTVQAQIRLTPFDGTDHGVKVLSDPFSIFNTPPNSAPILSQLSLLGTSGDINIGFQMSDSESDTLFLSFEFSLDAGNTWLPSTYTTPLLTSFSSPYIDHLTWHSSLEFSTDETAVKLRLIPSDNEITGSGLISEVVSILNNHPPDIDSFILTDPGPGDLSFSVNLSDADTDIISLDFDYTTDSQLTWIRSTQTTPILTSPPLYGFPFTWHSTHDFLIDVASVEVRLTPSDGKTTGASITTGPFSVLNFPNTPPKVTNLTALGASGAIIFDFTLADDESDPVNLNLEYSLDGGSQWSTSTHTIPITQSLTMPSRLVWQSGLDFQSETSALSVRLTPFDTKTIGLSESLTLTSVNNLPNYPITSALDLRSRLVPGFRINQLVPYYPDPEQAQDPGPIQVLTLNRDMDMSSTPILSPITWGTTDQSVANALSSSETYGAGKFTVFKHLGFKDIQELRSIVETYIGTGVPNVNHLTSSFSSFVQSAYINDRLETNLSASLSTSFETLELCTGSATFCDSFSISDYFGNYDSSIPYTFFFMPSLQVARSDGLPDYTGNYLTNGVQGYYPTTIPMVDLFPFGEGSMRQLHSPTGTSFDFDSSGSLYIPTSAFKSDIKSIPITLYNNFNGVELPDSNALTQSLTKAFYPPDFTAIPSSEILSFSQIAFANGNAEVKSILHFLKTTNGGLFLHGFAEKGDTAYHQPYTTLQNPSQPALNIMRVILLSSSDIDRTSPPFMDTSLFIGDSISFSTIETYVSVSGSQLETRFQQRDVREILSQYYPTLSVTFGNTTTIFTDVFEVTRYESVFPVVNITNTSTYSVDPSTNATVGELHKVTNYFGRHAGVVVIEEITNHNIGGQNPVLEKKVNREVIGALDIIGGQGGNKTSLPQ